MAGDVGVGAARNAGKKRWYIIHTLSGAEKSVQNALKEKIASSPDEMQKCFGEIIVPTQTVVEIGKGGTRKAIERTTFVGYIVVEMVMSERTWSLVRDTPKVTGFVGGNQMASDLASIPWMLPNEVNRLKAQAERKSGDEAPPKIQYTKGERIRICSGTFINFEGPVEEVDNTKGRLKIAVPMFGRPTVVEIDFSQVEKVSS